MKTASFQGNAPYVFGIRLRTIPACDRGEFECPAKARRRHNMKPKF